MFFSVVFAANNLSVILLCFVSGLDRYYVVGCGGVWFDVVLCSWFCGTHCLGCFCRHGFGDTYVGFLFVMFSTYLGVVVWCGLMWCSVVGSLLFFILVVSVAMVLLTNML